MANTADKEDEKEREPGAYRPRQLRLASRFASNHLTSDDMRGE